MIAELDWFTSSYSNDDGGDCVEIAFGPGAVLVRDSKDRAGARLTFTPDAWRAFVAFAVTHDAGGARR
ncbi:DUF397 domain-containing protein [Streptomyces sp. NPDC002574]|uniref:DUF397 domain-containing protein n=1 Tax=Streptomyces sp. NPDC002574 TaxID=3364652 RepID=UPI0036B73073